MEDKIITVLKQKGYRITEVRRLLAAELAAATMALSVSEIYDSLRKACPQISLDTVYRNINILVSIGMLMPISGLGNDSVKYELNDRHHHHIVCVECGHVACIDYCPVDDRLSAIINQQGYELLSHNIELYGLCQACQQKRGLHE